MELTKEYLKTRENDAPDLGNFVHYYIYINKIKKKKVSEFLNVQPTTLNGYFKQSSFQFSILWRISQITEHNFLMQLGERLGIPYETKAEKELKAQLAEKEALIQKQAIHLEAFREMIGSAK